MMEVSFDNARLQKLCNSEKHLRGKYGPRMGALIQQRLAELAGAETLDDLKSIVGANCHELSQNLKGLLAVSLVYPDRLLFRPDHHPLPCKPDGGLDWAGVNSIVVVGIGDYHEN